MDESIEKIINSLQLKKNGYRSRPALLLPGKRKRSWPLVIAAFLALMLLVWMNDAGAQENSHGRNYEEEKVHPYTVPDPLLRPDGSRVKDAEDWESWRRADVLRDFQDLMYGHTPDLPVRLRPEMVASRSDAVHGLATRTIWDLALFEDSEAPHIQLMLYLPNGAEGPVPVFLGLNFYGNASLEKDSLIPLPRGWMRPHSSPAVIDNRATEALRGLSESRWPLELVLHRGYGVASFYYGDVEPDHIEGWRDGIRGYALERAGRSIQRPDDWGALGAWGWGLSRALDFLETVPAVDARRVVVFGHSRLGKAALWAGAQDQRFAIVISNNSGEGGASLARRNFGENIAYSIAHASWRYCDRFREYIDREEELPFDQHMLLGLIAPRPVYIASATEDLLSDPKGEFVSAALAEPIYRLYSKQGVDTAVWPPPETPVGQSVGYHLRTGKHDITSYDWGCYLDFADRQWKTEAR
ncbi:MAG: acetylxylan esterase [Bacteroidota bacterium]